TSSATGSSPDRLDSRAVQESAVMGLAWAMIGLIVVGGALFFVAVTTHQWGLFALMALLFATAAIWGTQGTFPRGDGSEHWHYYPDPAAGRPSQATRLEKFSTTITTNTAASGAMLMSSPRASARARWWPETATSSLASRTTASST